MPAKIPLRALPAPFLKHIWLIISHFLGNAYHCFQNFPAATLIIVPKPLIVTLHSGSLLQKDFFPVAK